MATTYGFGGEFSSDEDIERIEQQSERVVQSKFNDNLSARPSVQQIEETIEVIRNLSPDDDIKLSDDLLAGLLDHFKTQRGPIVDSTRKLYKKIALRIIREGSQQQVKESNGNANHNNNNNNNNNSNNNDNDMITKHKPPRVDSFSSDEDEPVLPVNQGTLKKRLDLGIATEDKPLESEDIESMEVDSEGPPLKGAVREIKQVGMSTDDDDYDDDHEDSESSSESEELNSESDVLDVTPIKPPKTQPVVSSERAKIAASALNTPRQAHTESSVKRQPLAQSTPKDSTMSTAKKPYTRSQKLAAARAVTSDAKASDSFIGSKTTALSTDGRRLSRRKLILAGTTFIVALLSYLIYHFRGSISKATVSRSGINFG